MKQMSTEIEISASSTRAWQVLTDFPSFSQWNPFIPSAQGEVKVGERLTVKMTPPKGMGMTFNFAIADMKMQPALERALGRRGC